MKPHSPSRREFLQTGAAGVAAAALSGAAAPEGTNPGGILLRPLGRTDEKVSVLCLGGHASTNPQKLSEQESLRLIQRAVDEGITFMDNCWDYHNGVAEERMGKALAEGGRRNKTFLMTKCCGRNVKDAQSNLEESLRRLKTDHLDLWQFHEIVYDSDPSWVFAEDGAIHAGLKALKEGKVRYLGFTGHKDPSIHLDMLSKPYEWATVQMPLNVMDVHYRSFQKKVLPVLLERQIGVLAMKSLGGNGSIVTKAGVSVEDALRYVLSLPISTLVSGIDSEKVLDQNLKIVRDFKPLTAEEKTRIEQSTIQVAGDGRFELFKSSKAFDGPVHRKQHGFDTAIS
ncbi:aldo/keto reductase [Singulisphaera acidiphila]|uniref:Putative oxidoreductase of aldo/keto reductase family n=1 Tax=Singulisphaera acidiphila (strain ATCC BAA-1392 / DSM 18658 / VKM B-2454 / MOB10) TaxID=886293 RepID=L0DMS4_SINAD|nr:aldo/keto reductase [Singulisphaera acidiphila]AGA29966.1 putative oxidoreductase of aldo/keto reductase family [Singulisphaera acidiphila DSM 18658]